MSAIGDVPLLAELALSLGLGLLIGVQRGWTLRHEAAGSRFAGIRTYGLLGLTGGIAGVIEPIDRPVAVLLLGGAALLILFGYARTARTRGSVSGTAGIAALIALACGYLATRGEARIASIAAVTTTLLLTLRPQLHRWVGTLTEAEVGAIARFALIAAVILPLLPDRALGPYDAWNPRQLWLVVVFVSGFSFAGYIAGKRFGATRGTLAMAATGAMVSSTAVTTALATRLRDEAENAPILIAGIAAASVVMQLRVMLLVALIAPRALESLALIVVPALLVSLAATGWALLAARRGDGATAAPVELRNPLNFGPALGLIALVMVMALLVRWLMERVGDTAIAALLALSGIADVDAAIITIGGLPAGVLGARAAGMAIAASVLANTLLKAIIPPALARTRRGWTAALPLIASAAAGTLAAALLL
ncbi:MgtC/SapB family protein [Sphingopyxis indica]|uniref:Uncharacterized membrane protein, DUF4010 family n=1 Tax=Sphingopyxis indica TaxID=436663 RepID=A0A239L9I9_9SPHN|nr:DUF4010 domain-containing protein [Sphingopyxis indica]SNT27297.1 Uncharacterized membrane protein, DUF4010 family [Sphingopyxis indica]